MTVHRIVSKALVFMLSASWLLSGGLGAQTTRGVLQGRVTDQTGAVLPAATVTVTRLDTGISAIATTNAEGYYVVPSLLPGRYSVRVEKQGFQTKLIQPIELNVDGRVSVDVSLAVRGTEEVVTITSEGPLVEPNSASLGQVVKQQAVQDLPLNGRNFLQLALLSAGAAPLGAVSDTAGFDRPSVNISGGREASNQFTIDGVFNNAVHMEGLNIQLSVDAIQEFKVQRNTFSAEFGQGTAVINVASRTGGNQFHGTAYEFLRNDVLDARQFFDTSVPPFRQNQYGFSVSGPIVKDRTFFFVNYEGFRRRRANTIIATLPTQSELSGIFSSPVKDPVTGKPFDGNTVPPDRISPLSKRVIALLPKLSAGGANNYRTTRSEKNDFDQFTVRIDHRFSTKDAIFARYTFLDSTLFNPGIIDMSGVAITDRPQNVGVQWTHTVSPNLLNEARIGFNRNLQNRLQEGAYGQDLLQQRNVSSNPVVFGLPAVNMVGYSVLAFTPTYPEIVGGNTMQYDDVLTWVHNQHTLKVGADYRNVQFPHTPALFARGYYVFQGLATGNPVADFLLGNPFVTLGAGKVATAYASIPNFSVFVQDDWKLSPRFTLNLGLRYERIGAVTDRFRGYFSTFDEATGKFVAGKDVEAQGLVNPDNNDFSPRFGFAWQPFANARTVIRGGYGVYYDVKPINERQFGLGVELGWQQIVDISPLLGVPPAVVWDKLFPDAPAQGIGVLADDPRARTPYVQQYNLSIQHELGWNLLVEAAYAGSLGRKLNTRIDINQARLPSYPEEPLPPRRPWPDVASIWMAKDIATSNYNALQLRMEKRFSQNLYWLSAYTYSKSMDTGSVNLDSPQDAHNLLANYGPSVFDQRHRFVLSSIYQLPFGAGQKYLSNTGAAGSTLLSGWQVNAIVTFAGGNPLSVQAAGDRTQTGCQGCVQRANVVGSAPANLPSSQRTVQRWFNTAAFQAAPLGTFGNAGRNTIVGPGTNNFDLSLIKDTRLGEGKSLQFRAEFFNAFNHPQFFLPNGDPTSQAFGQITAARPAREIQFGLKFIF